MSLAELQYEVNELLKGNASITPVDALQTLLPSFPALEGRGFLVWKAMLKYYVKHPEFVDEDVVKNIVDFMLYGAVHPDYDNVTVDGVTSMVFRVLEGTFDYDILHDWVEEVLDSLLGERMENWSDAWSHREELEVAGFFPKMTAHHRVRTFHQGSAASEASASEDASSAPSSTTRPRRRSKSPSRHRRRSKSRSRSRSKSRSRSRSRSGSRSRK